jgi:hypothetical protein
MGGLGSGRQGGKVLVENAIRLNIDTLLRRCGIQRGGTARGMYHFDFYDQELSIDFVIHIGDPGDSWLRLRYRICDYWTGEPHDIDELIYLVVSRPPFGGLRWWFVCPLTRRRVRMLHLPLGARRFACRRAYRLAYASQRGTATDRAHRGQAKIKARLIGDLDPDEWDLPPKPKWMRWRTYNRYVEKFDNFECLIDQECAIAAARFLQRWR